MSSICTTLRILSCTLSLFNVAKKIQLLSLFHQRKNIGNFLFHSTEQNTLSHGIIFTHTHTYNITTLARTKVYRRHMCFCLCVFAWEYVCKRERGREGEREREWCEWKGELGDDVCSFILLGEKVCWTNF